MPSASGALTGGGVGLRCGSAGIGGLDRTSCDKTDPQRNEPYSDPSGDLDILVEKKLGQQRHEDVSNRRCREHICKIREGECSQVAGEKSEEQDDSGANPGSKDGRDR